MHIPPERLLPQDLIDIFDHGPVDEPHDAPVKHRMHAVDAKHAMQVEPSRWKLHSVDLAEDKPADPNIKLIEDKSDE